MKSTIDSKISCEEARETYKKRFKYRDSIQEACYFCVPNCTLYVSNIPLNLNISVLCAQRRFACGSSTPFNARLHAK